jgi:hypothetical protein
MGVVGVDVGVRNLSLCAIHRNPTVVEYWKVLDCTREWESVTAKSWGEKTRPIAEQVEAVILTLNAERSWFDENVSWITHALIEAQPVGVGASSGNTTMKSVQHAIQAWFMCVYPSVDVVMVSPKIKLGKVAPAAYSQRKKMAVQIVKSILAHESAGDGESSLYANLGNKWLQVIAQSSKADDLADAFLIAHNYAGSLKPRRGPRVKNNTNEASDPCENGPGAKRKRVTVRSPVFTPPRP